MAHDADPLAAQICLREHRFESHTPLLGPFIVRLRSAWYNVAARWGDQSLIHQQTAYNQAAAQRITELAQHIAEHDRRIAEYDQRLILADRDLIDLTRTVAELTQQVIELRHILADVQAARTRS